MLSQDECPSNKKKTEFGVIWAKWPFTTIQTPRSHHDIIKFHRSSSRCGIYRKCSYVQHSAYYSIHTAHCACKPVEDSVVVTLIKEHCSDSHAWTPAIYYSQRTNSSTFSLQMPFTLSITPVLLFCIFQLKTFNCNNEYIDGEILSHREKTAVFKAFPSPAETLCPSIHSLTVAAFHCKELRQL